MNERPKLQPRRHRYALTIAAVVALQLVPVLAPAATPVTYTGPAAGSWSDPANWSTGTVPDNTPPDTYDVTLNTTVHFDLPSATIDNLTLAGVNPTLTISANHHLTIAGSLSANAPTLSRPAIDVTGGSLTAPNLTNVLITGSGGSSTFPAVTSYTCALQSDLTTLLNLSFPDLRSIDTSRMVSPQTAAIYFIEAYRGTPDLSHVTTVTGPGTLPGAADDELWFLLGDTRLDSLATVTGNVKFLPEPGRLLRLPSLRSVSRGTTVEASDSTIDLPSLQSASYGARFTAINGTINLTSFSTAVAPPAGCQDPPVQISALDRGTINLGSITQSPGHLSLVISETGHIVAQDLWLGPDVTVSAPNLGVPRLTINGSFVYTPKSDPLGTLNAGILELTPAPGTTGLLEAGAPVSILVIGTSTQPATVRVVDLYDGGETTGPESLHLYSRVNKVLTLYPGSVLDLGGVDVYLEQYPFPPIYLNSLFGDKTEIPWDQGTLRNTPFNPLPGDTAPFDARVDLTDLNNVLNHLSSADRTIALSLIPEPASLLLLTAGYALLSTLRVPRRPTH